MQASFFGNAARRIVLMAVTAVLLVASGVSLLYGQREARLALIERFEARAEIAAVFMTTFTADVIATEQRLAAQYLSGSAPSHDTLAQVSNALGFQAAVLLDSTGALLQVFPPRPELIGQDMTAAYAHLEAAVEGRIAVSNVVPSAAEAIAVTAFAIPFDTPSGRRVFSGALAVDATPLGEYLSDLTPIGNSEVYLLDSNSNTVSSDLSSTHLSMLHDRNPALESALQERDRGRYPIGDRWGWFVSVPIEGTPWRLIVAAPEEDLLSPLAGAATWVPWLLFAAVMVSAVTVTGVLIRLSATRAAQLLETERFSGRQRDLIAEMQGILDAAVEAVLVVDETGIIRRANMGAAAMFATTESNMVGGSYSTYILEVEPLPDHPKEQLNLTKGHRADGTAFWAETSESGISEPPGHRRRAVIVRDVTDRIETEDRVRRVQDEFVSNMTHELKTPLTAIIGFTEWLLSNPDSPSVAEDLEVIRTSAVSLQDLIDNILDFKRLSATATRQTAAVDLESLVLQVVSMNRTSAAARDVTVTFSKQSASPVNADRLQMEQAIRNLVSNAVKYSKTGGKVEITLERTDGSVVLSVSDDGIGISDEDQKRIFQRFFRASNTGEIRGTGLGLAMVRQIAEGHGGKLILTSNLGEGTRVEMHLPAFPEPAQADETQPTDGSQLSDPLDVPSPLARAN
jgi:PAS domain S-box-containing protein